MAARSIGSGTIAFGLVSIPVKLYSTIDSTKAVRFNYLTPDGERVKQQYVRADDGEPIERAQLQQGYEFAKGQYVMFTPEEIKAMHVESTNAIDIAEFVPLAEIERIYIDKVYYLGPDKGAARSYHLLKDALGQTGRAALASYAARGKSHLVLIRPFSEGDQSGLVMEQLKHQEELRRFEHVPVDSDQAQTDEAELDLAVKIIEQRVNDEFEPERFEDAVRSHMLEVIQQKVDGQEIAVPSDVPAEEKIVDLMAALKASVDGKSAGSAKKTTKARKTTTRKSPARATKKTATKRTARKKTSG